MFLSSPYIEHFNLSRFQKADKFRDLDVRTFKFKLLYTRGKVKNDPGNRLKFFYKFVTRFLQDL